MTLDTSAMVAAMDHRDVHHISSITILENEPGSLVIPTPIMAEITYFIERRWKTAILSSFLADIDDGVCLLDCCDADLTGVRELVTRYDDLPLGFADASVIACAERRGGRVLTFDLPHFGVVASEGRIQLLH